MPWGKFKGTPICDVPESYKDWLCNQEGFKEKNPVLYRLFDEGDNDEISTADERKAIDLEGPLLDPMPPAFKSFWKRAYGERMRVHGQIQYIAFLRVACESWKEASSAMNNAPLSLYSPLPSASVPDANKPKMLPPPLGHIPAPVGYKQKDEPASPEVPF